MAGELTPEALAAARKAGEALAPVLGRYFACLVEAGFTRDEALTLTVGLQSTMLGIVATIRRPAP